MSTTQKEKSTTKLSGAKVGKVTGLDYSEVLESHELMTPEERRQFREQRNKLSAEQKYVMPEPARR